MTADSSDLRSLDALRRLGGKSLLQAMAEYLARNGASISTELHAMVVAEVPAYTESRDSVTLRELAVDGPHHIAEIARLLQGGQVGDFEFVRRHARLRADHHFPLEALLHAYRCGHKVYLRWLRDAAWKAVDQVDVANEVIGAIVDFVIDYIDAISTEASAAYVDQTRLLADVAGDERAQLLNILLGGYDESDARVAAILRDAGYLDCRQTFCVVFAQSVDTAEMANPARARRLANTLDQLVPGDLARRLIDVRDGRVVCVFSATARASGWTHKKSSLATRLTKEMMLAGNAVRIGVSSDVASTSRIGHAQRQALLALRMANLTHRVVHFAAMPLRQLMIHLAGDDLQRLLPDWVGDFYDADDKTTGMLSETLRAYAEADMNVLKAALRLDVHPNTVYARMSRIREITALNSRSYFALTDLLTVVDARAATGTYTA